MQQIYLFARKWCASAQTFCLPWPKVRSTYLRPWMDFCHYSCLCHYLNKSRYLIILKLIYADKILLEKVLFPFEEWYFDAPVEAHVELWSNGLSGAELLDRFEAGSLANAL
ncbi:DUF1830 domain-containing protein [Synechococcus sp. CBW1108]|nr:DUF1830 domain-containing protein [Synechococcus sp. CBW1108]